MHNVKEESRAFSFSDFEVKKKKKKHDRFYNPYPRCRIA